MTTTRTSTLVLLLGVLLSACPSAPAPSKADANKAEPNKPKPADKATTISPSQAPARAGVTPIADAAGSTPAPMPAAAGDLGPAPAWFDPAAYEHAAIIRQDLSGSRLASGQASAMLLLELKPGTTAEQCIEMGRAKLGETIPNLPASSTTPQGYLQMQGKHETYEYTLVCGVAKDKPTMFLSYTQ